MADKKRNTNYKSIDKYNLENYSRIDIRLPKELVADFKNKCAADGISQAAIIKSAIEEYLK